MDRSISLPCTFSDVFSTGSVDLSTEVEACDLFSHVDSEDWFCTDDTSSSFVTVDDDDAPRSGDEIMEAAGGGWELPWLDVGGGPLLRSRLIDFFSELASFASASSAQLVTEVPVALAGVGAASLDGVKVPEDGLDEGAVDGPVEDRPLAAWAYENGTGAAVTSLPDRRGVAAMVVFGSATKQSYGI